MNRHIKTTVLLIAAATFITAFATPATAVETTELAEALDAYRITQREMVEFEQAQLLAELRIVNGPYDDSNTEFAWAVERWRPVVDTYFPEDRVDWALRIIECESHGDPEAKNPTSSASGLFQHLGSLWNERTLAAGWEGADIFDPFANIAMAAWLFETGGPGHWVCKARR
jgi:hypothetical protein